uniref:Uncharacterized protein n=1 Tax=Lygus hesperus TaxID=30085 RepID=A0A146LK37_LYGHE
MLCNLRIHSIHECVHRHRRGCVVWSCGTTQLTCVLNNRNVERGRHHSLQKQHRQHGGWKNNLTHAFTLLYTELTHTPSPVPCRPQQQTVPIPAVHSEHSVQR